MISCTAHMSTENRTSHAKQGPEHQKTRNEETRETVGTFQQKENNKPLPTENRFQRLSDLEEENTEKLSQPNPSFADSF